MPIAAKEQSMAAPADIQRRKTGFITKKSLFPFGE